MKMTIISVVPTDMEVSAGKFLNEVYCKDENGRVGLMYSAKSYKPGDAADVGICSRRSDVTSHLCRRRPGDIG